jgi:predicted phage terminase large subunit-like protein
MIQLYDSLPALPKNLSIYGASDFATMEPRKGKKEPDFTEHGIWGIDRPGNLYAIDWWSKQCETDLSIAAWMVFVKRWSPLKWFNEGGLIDKAIGPTIRRAMREGGKFTVVESLPSIQDKGAKLQAFHARAHAKTVFFPAKRKWADRVIEQLIKFPGGRWDDAADVCGLIGRGIDQMANPHVPLAERRPEVVPFTGKWLEWNDRPDKPKVRYF